MPSRSAVARLVYRVPSEWEDCWEDVLRLAVVTLADDALYRRAEGLVRTCRSSVGDRGIDWFHFQVRDGQAFVAEQLRQDHENPEWRRIKAVLDGAHSGTELDAMIVRCPEGAANSN